MRIVFDKIESRLGSECKQILNELNKHNNVVLLWVPEYRNIWCNEESDGLAKEGVCTRRAHWVQNPHILGNLKKSSNLRHDGAAEQTFQEAPRMRQPKLHISGPSSLPSNNAPKGPQIYNGFLNRTL